jgi:hypothetical protein
MVSPKTSRIAREKVLLGVGALSCGLLAFQAAVPIEGGISAPAWCNWLLLSGGVLGLGTLAWRGQEDERWASLVSLLSIAHLVFVGRLWSGLTSLEMASLLSSSLSQRPGGLAFVALAHGFSALALAWCCGRALIRTVDPPQPTVVTASAYSVALIIGAVGVRALLGYATGSPSLFAP